MRLPVSFTLLLGLAFAVRASAQSPPLRLTLDEAIARGLAASHRLGEAAARQQGADAVVGQRQAARRPQVGAQAGYTRTNHVEEFGVLLPSGQLRLLYPDVPDNYRSRIEVSLPLYTGGRLQAFEHAARQEWTAAGDDALALRGDVRLDIERAFWSLVVADESVRVIDEALARTAAHVANVRNSLTAGLVPPNEVSTAEAQEARQRMFSIQGHARREIAEADLARQTGLPPGTAIVTETASAPESPGADPEALTTLAAAQRKDRQALVDRMGAMSLRGEAAAAARRPTIAVAGGADYANPNPRIFPRSAEWRSSWDASVNVSWSLFDGGRAKAEVAEAAAARRALEARLAELDAAVALDIRQRLAELTSSRAAVEAADAALTAANEALRVVNDRFAAGVAISTDVLDAQGLVLQASLDRTQALVAGRMAAAQLRRAIGQ